MGFDWKAGPPKPPHEDGWPPAPPPQLLGVILALFILMLAVQGAFYWLGPI